MTNLLYGQGLMESAILLATAAHAGVTDKTGREPYIFHPLRVMLAVPRDPIIRAVAVLHDCVEDTTVTLKDLAEDYPEAVVEAVDALTKREGEVYRDYIARVAANDIARLVKLTDLADNLDPYRLEAFDASTQQSLRKRYEGARETLLMAPWEK